MQPHRGRKRAGFDHGINGAAAQSGLAAYIVNAQHAFYGRGTFGRGGFWQVLRVVHGLKAALCWHVCMVLFGLPKVTKPVLWERSPQHARRNSNARKAWAGRAWGSTGSVLSRLLGGGMFNRLRFQPIALGRSGGLCVAVAGELASFCQQGGFLRPVSPAPGGAHVPCAVLAGVGDQV